MEKRGPSDWLEGRRLRAYELAEEGWAQQDIAAMLGVSEGAVSKWLKRGREGGREALRRHPAPGAASKLSAEQLATLPAILARGAEAYGFRGARWTRARIRQVIEDELGMSYHVDHMSYLMNKIGWTQQTPREVATQQSQGAVEAWQATWSAVEKKPSKKGKR